MSPSYQSARPHATTQHNPLVTPIPIDAVIAASQEWNARDRGFAAHRQALETGITALRELLQSEHLTAAERPGSPQPTPDAAAHQIGAAGTALDRALHERRTAQGELESAYAAAEQALVVVRDVRLAQRAVVFVAVLLFVLLARWVVDG